MRTGDLAIAPIIDQPSPTPFVITSDALLEFFARLHPVLVHFPVGLLIAAAVFELVYMMFGRRAEGAPQLSPGARACLALGMTSAVLAAWSGWIRQDLHPIGGELEGIVTAHRWVAIAATAVAALALLLCVPANRRSRTARVYRLCLVLAAGLVGVAGHFGGSLTWGPEYLTELLFPAETPPPPVERTTERSSEPPPAVEPDRSTEPATNPSNGVIAVDFVADIEPILELYCYDCHGPRRQKGRLRLDRRGDALTGDVVVPGDPDGSELIRRVLLHPDDDEFMPQDDDPLSESQVASLRAWILAGAPYGPSADPPPEAAAEPDAPAPPNPAPPPLTDPQRAALERLGALGGAITPLDATDRDLDVHLALAGDRFTDAEAVDLQPLAERVVWLNLAGTGITDAAVRGLADLPRLERVHLQRTAVTDAGVEALTSLPHLRYLNLHSTRVTDACLASIAAMPALEQVYLWDSGVTPEGVAVLRAARPSLRVVDRPE